MAPRGSFNHLIESPACLGFSPSSFAPHRRRRPVLILTNTFERADDYLRTISRVPSFLPPLLHLLFEHWRPSSVVGPLSQPCNIRLHSWRNSSSLDRYPRGGLSPASVQMAPLILDSNIQIQRVAEPFRVQNTHSADLRRIAVTCENIDVMKESRCLRAMTRPSSRNVATETHKSRVQNCA